MDTTVVIRETPTVILADGQNVVVSESTQFVTVASPGPQSSSHEIILVSSNYSAQDVDSTLVCDGTFTVTLPIAKIGRSINVKNVGTGIITVDALGPSLIDGEVTQELYEDDCMDTQYFGSNVWGIT